jgi:hypothetical protein
VEKERRVMPYKSKKQRAFMHIHHPLIAKKWDKEYGTKIGGGHKLKKNKKKDK